MVIFRIIKKLWINNNYYNVEIIKPNINYYEPIIRDTWLG